MSEMKAIMKRLASGLRKQECRQHCRRLTHVCPHSDRSLGLIDREQSGCHYGLSLPVSLSFLPSFSLREPLSSVLACRAFLSFFFSNISCIHIDSTRQNWRFPEGIAISWGRNKPTNIDSWTFNITTLFVSPLFRLLQKSLKMNWRCFFTYIYII